jgi:uncharacterized ferredoxin-like protein
VPKVQSFDKNMTEVQIKSGRVAKQDRKGQFEVSESEAKFLRKSGAFTLVGAGMATTGVPGFVCPDCGRENVIRDHCGRCGWSESTDNAQPVDNV